MSNLLADDVLCAKGLAVLEDQLGPVQALRFLALTGRQPFDYPSMPKVHVTSQIEIDLDEVLQGLARLGTQELEQFLEKVIALQAQGRDGIAYHRTGQDDIDIRQAFDYNGGATVMYRACALMA